MESREIGGSDRLRGTRKERDPGPAGRGTTEGGTPANIRGRRRGILGVLAALAGIGASVLPVGACPACWPIYAGLLGSVGLGFLLKGAYLLPLTALFLGVAVAALAYRAGTRRGHGPFLVGLAAAVLVLAGKFFLESEAAMYGGVVLLVVASLWNAWPVKRAGDGGGTCTACAPGGRGPSMNQPGA